MRDWIERWDEQQERYLPHREERFAVMLDLVAKVAGGRELRLLDLCCGNGSISRRALARFPDASILAVDRDPSLLELGRSTLDARVTWRSADIRDTAWAEGLEPESFDAVLSATAIHWLQLDDVVQLYRTLAELLRAGGIFANADHMPVSTPRVAALSQALLDEWQNVRLEGAEDYADYREALRDDPRLGPFVDERDREFADQPPGIAAPLAFHRDALLSLGFDSADEVWRYHADAVIVAVR